MVQQSNALKSSRYSSRASVYVHINLMFTYCDLVWLLDSFLQNGVTNKQNIGTVVQKETPERGQRRMARLDGADRTTMLTKIATLCNSGEQRSVTECITHPASRRIGYNKSRKIHWVPLRNVMLHRKQAQHKRTVEYWPDDSGFLLIMRMSQNLVSTAWTHGPNLPCVTWEKKGC